MLPHLNQTRGPGFSCKSMGQEVRGHGQQPAFYAVKRGLLGEVEGTMDLVFPPSHPWEL